jgi:Xaa-Pro dipeptidase
VQNEIEIKTERIQKMLAAENLGGVLLNAQHNFAWATGGRSNQINASIEPGACFLLFRADGKRFVLANNIEMSRILSEEILETDFEPIEFSWEDEKSAGDFVVKKAAALLEDNSNLASDLYFTPEARSIENLIARCRFELTEQEIERYRKLGKDAGAAIGNLFGAIEPGETETQIARKAKNALEAYGIDSVVTLVGADERIAKYRHPAPTANVWKKVLLIAVCAKREGLIASLSRVACVGEIPDELKRRTEATAFVFARLAAATETGASGAQLYQIAADAYAEKGFAGEINFHHQGGAAGYKSRDWVAHPKNGETVVQNQAFAWNPTVAGAKTEETFITSGEGFEIITASPNFPQISIETNGREISSPGVLSL